MARPCGKSCRSSRSSVHCKRMTNRRISVAISAKTAATDIAVELAMLAERPVGCGLETKTGASFSSSPAVVFSSASVGSCGSAGLEAWAALGFNFTERFFIVIGGDICKISSGEHNNCPKGTFPVVCNQGQKRYCILSCNAARLRGRLRSASVAQW